MRIDKKEVLEIDSRVINSRTKKRCECCKVILSDDRPVIEDAELCVACAKELRRNM